MVPQTTVDVIGTGPVPQPDAVGILPLPMMMITTAAVLRGATALVGTITVAGHLRATTMITVRGTVALPLAADLWTMGTDRPARATPKSPTTLVVRPHRVAAMRTRT